MQQIDEIVVTSAGMISSLGTTWRAACAAQRAGLSRAREHEFSVIQSAPLLCCSVAGRATGYQGNALLTALCESALRDLLLEPQSQKLVSASGRKLDLRIAIPRVPCIPEVEGSAAEHELHDVLGVRQDPHPAVERALSSLGISPPERTFFYSSHHAAGILAIADAADAVLKGGRPAALVGGIYSGVDEDTLICLLESGRLKGESNPHGMIPGEAGAFVLLEREVNALARGVSPLARLRGIGTGSEPRPRHSREPSTGVGLRDAIRQATNASDRQLGGKRAVIGDLNGEDYRSQEWGAALAHLAADVGPGFGGFYYPTAEFGDTGTASSLIGICVAIHGMVRDRDPLCHALVWSSSDGPDRAAISLERYEKRGPAGGVEPAPRHPA